MYDEDDAEDINWVSMYLVVGCVFAWLAARETKRIAQRLFRRVRRQHVD